MRDKNFNAISKFEVPKAWVDKVLEIPSTPKKKKTLLLMNLYRSIAAVICLVFVCVISITVLYLTKDNSIPPVDNNSPSIVNDTENTTDNSTQTDFKDKTGKPSKKPSNSVLPTFHMSDDNEVDENIEETKPSSVKPTEDATKPTSSQKPSATEQTHQTEEPSVATDIPPVETEPPDSVEPLPTEPCEPPVDEPTLGDSICVGYFDSSKITGSGRIYCRIYMNGEILGGNDTSDLHLVDYVYISGYGRVIVKYDARKVMSNKSGNITYSFYNENGGLLYTSSKYVPQP